MKLSEILALSDHGPDTSVGSGPRYPWGGLYGGQIVAQALRAAALSVPRDFDAHSLRAYFIRRGTHQEPVRYEIDRIRNGRSFCTRRVVARQPIGAILNLEASFQRPEASEDIENIVAPIRVPGPEELDIDSWSPTFERALVPSDRQPPDSGGGRAMAWLRSVEVLDDEIDRKCALAFMSDDLPTDAVVRLHPLNVLGEAIFERVFSASLDHTVWFHRDSDPSEWHLYDVSCHTFIGGRGLTVGAVYSQRGVHVATVAQEVLLRDKLGMAAPGGAT